VICDTGHDGPWAGRNAYTLFCHKERVATEAHDHVAWINKFTGWLSEVPYGGAGSDICRTPNDLYVSRAWGECSCSAAGKQ